MNTATPTLERVQELDAKVTAALAAGVKSVEGNSYMQNAKGALVPLATVKPVDKLMDDTVRRMLAFATDLSEQIARFRGHCFDDVGAFQALIAEKYEASVGGEKGNVTLTSFDGCQQVKIQVADRLTFGPELQAAKKLVDECLAEWSADAHPAIRGLVTLAFNVDQDGKINRSDIFTLMRMEVADDRWQRAVDAMHDSIRVIGSATYIRFFVRPNPQAKWTAITIDLASA
jgi:hypothetical protein